MKILAIVSGEYGLRHVTNIQAHAPAGWEINTWHAPSMLPPMIDYPEDYLPQALPPTDLILSFAEHRGVAELIPDMATMTGAKAVIAAVDSEAWLPRGLARQLRGWLERLGVECVTPKPLCSLTDTDYGVTRRERVTYSHPFIKSFATHFGQPQLKITVDPETRTIKSASVERDAVCGCARYVAERLIGITADEAPEKSGLLHHHFPCLASMGIDSDFDDTLMHVSGNVLKENVSEQVRPHQTIRYIAPGTRSD